MAFRSSVLEVRYPSHLEIERHPPKFHFQKSTLRLSSMESKIVENQAPITF